MRKGSFLEFSIREIFVLRVVAFVEKKKKEK